MFKHSVWHLSCSCGTVTGAVLASRGTVALQGAGVLGQGYRMPGEGATGVSPAQPLPKGSGQREGLLPAPSCGESQLSRHCRDPSGCLAVMLTFLCKASGSDQVSLLDKAVGKGKHAPESKQVRKGVCGRRKEHEPLRRGRALLQPGGTRGPGCLEVSPPPPPVTLSTAPRGPPAFPSHGLGFMFSQ